MKKTIQLFKFEFWIYDVKLLTFALIRCHQRIGIITLETFVDIFRITFLTVVNIACCTGNCTLNDISKTFITQRQSHISE